MSALAELAWPQVAARAAAGAILAVPWGSTEQHGPHLPLSTDTDVAVALAERLAAARPDVLVAPAIGYGSSGEHAGFAGTLSIGQEATELLAVELVRSATDTFARVVLVSAHGGNTAAVRRAVATLHAESRDVLAFFPTWDGDAHAGRTETALQLALHPERVGVERPRGDVRPITDLLPDLQRAGVRAVSPNGVLGDAGGASAEEGHAVLDALADDLIRAVATWSAQ